jgi:putative glutamine amidotransferase
MYPVDMKPLIGINLDIQAGPPQVARVRTNYYDAILAAGGIPVLVPPMPDSDLDELMPKLSGILLIGGLDYSPSLYGEQPCQTFKPVHEEREEFDLRLVRRAMHGGRDLPVLGICGGCQVLNIGLGGSLIQDIDLHIPGSSVDHRTPDDDQSEVHKHTIELEDGTRLASIYKLRRLDVVSAHHQAVKTLGRGLRACARAEDGIIEALEAPERRFTVGVQWHPERDFVSNQALFTEFISESSASASR